MTFEIGQDVYWLHGEHHRVAKVIELSEDKVRLSGMTSKYWIKKTTLIKKINQPYPSGRVGF